GTTVFYGSTITLQAHHGGHLNFTPNQAMQASATGPRPNALLTIWDIYDPEAVAPVRPAGISAHDSAARYGDFLLLQVGRHEIMGTSLVVRHGADSSGGGGVAGGRTDNDSGDGGGRSSVGATNSAGGVAKRNAAAAMGSPIAINFRAGNMEKARHIGRWQVLNAKAGDAAKGQEVCHGDQIVLQSCAWTCLASSGPASAVLVAC
ncbi:unnamed protein product, partial [Phaeothamnion confervicola]